ncbi:MAG: M23 family metallopeptidase [Verrucomicrobiae bacterium]|nr:M23 family metallopeptidase [Verrucomicrobiae bacterium]
MLHGSALAGSFQVPGTANPWLAGQPDGTRSSLTDSAPRQSPTLYDGAIEPGVEYLFRVEGSVSNIETSNGWTPDGGSEYPSHWTGSENGIANLVAPMGSLVGVFVGEGRPAGTGSELLNFAVIGTDFTLLRPALNQPFFIGDGWTGRGTGKQQRFAAPEGATRLFLGSMDAFEWRNNWGAFRVEVQTAPTADWRSDWAGTELRKRFELADRIADGIIIDGLASDWSGAPVYQEDGPDALLPGADLVSTRFLATRRGLYFCLSTMGPPQRDPYYFWLLVDYADFNNPDMEISLSADSQIAHFELGKNPSVTPFRSLQIAIREVVEGFVAWEDLAQALPEYWRSRVVGDQVRPWIRIYPFTWSPITRQVLDYGASAACFRLDVPIERLDPSIPASREAPTEIPLMMEGKSFVIQGAKEGLFGNGLHRDNWCYDLVAVDASHAQSNPRESNRPEDFYAFGRRIYAPMEGRVWAVQDSIVDHVAWRATEDLPSNYVLLRYGTEIITLGHNQFGSSPLRVGAVIRPGETVALVGNTGWSYTPHLHFHVHRGLYETTEPNLVPVRLRNVRVSLNPAPDDFWARDLPAWDIRSGFFVEEAPPRLVISQSSAEEIRTWLLGQPGRSYDLWERALDQVNGWQVLRSSIVYDGEVDFLTHRIEKADAGRLYRLREH